MPSTAELPAEIERTTWDAIVVGTGMGGGTLGHALAERGHRVLFLEKGLPHLHHPHAVRGAYPDDGPEYRRLSETERLRRLMEGGRSIDEMVDLSAKKRKTFRPFIGGGTGGSSALYGMVCERLFAEDFTPRSQHPDADGSTLPESWPIRYQDLSPWYAAAERLYRVHGSADPLRPQDSPESLLPPAPLTPGNAELFEHFSARGMHPYHLHMACETLPGCQTCQGRLCTTICKNDAATCCVEPAVTRFGAQLLTEATAFRLDADRTRVARLICHWRGRELVLRGKYVILAAGALISPSLLLSSKNEHWPQGLANEHDQVGRNLMRHCIDMVVVQAKSARVVEGQSKEIAFNDLYFASDAAGMRAKLGTVQSLGPIPTLGFFLNQQGMEHMRFFRPLLRWFWKRFFTRALGLAAIMEDLPYHENRVFPAAATGPDGRQHLHLEYRFHASEERRLKVFRQEFTRILQGYRPLTLRAASDNTAIAHVCGTCRFGDDPRVSVLNCDNRAHGLDNLYIADASFFPSSGGINPSLTIAANALRVAEHLHQRLG